MRKKRLTPEQIHFIREIYQSKKCAFCGFLKGIPGFGLHCTNDEIIRIYLSSQAPGICHCPYWKPDKDYIRKQMHNTGNQKSDHSENSENSEKF